MPGYVSILRDQETLFSKAVNADTFWSRTRGLLGRHEIKSCEAIVLSPCNQIHTFGMKFDIDVLFLDRHGVVVECKRELEANRVARCARASHVVEMASGSITDLHLAAGQQLEFRVSRSSS